jgi:hypothetical protein
MHEQVLDQKNLPSAAAHNKRLTQSIQDLRDSVKSRAQNYMMNLDLAAVQREKAFQILLKRYEYSCHVCMSLQGYTATVKQTS